MPTIGVDCHLTLTHANVNGGNPYGFILSGDAEGLGPATAIQREAFDDGDGAYTDKRKYFFTVLLSDSLSNPDGTDHAGTKSAEYALLLSFFSQRTDITLTTPAGVFAGLKATAHHATETHFGAVMQIACQLNDLDAVYEPADTVLYLSSAWLLDTDTSGSEWTDGTDDSETGYWTEG